MFENGNNIYLYKNPLGRDQWSGCEAERSAPTAVNQAQVVRRRRSEGIHSSVVFHLPGSRGFPTAARGSGEVKGAGSRPEVH